jgi:hypothetical protein
MPLTVPLLVATTAVSAGAQIYSGVEGQHAANAAGTAAQQASESQAQLDEYNAQVAELQAQDQLTQGERQAQQLEAQVKQVIGTQRTGFAAGNVDVSTGSAAEVQTDAAYAGALDAITARNNATRAAWGYKVQAEDLRQQAAITRKAGANAAAAYAAQGDAALTGGFLGAAGTILGTSSSLLMRRYGLGTKPPSAGSATIGGE